MEHGKSRRVRDFLIPRGFIPTLRKDLAYCAFFQFVKEAAMRAMEWLRQKEGGYSFPFSFLAVTTIEVKISKEGVNNGSWNLTIVCPHSFHIC